MVQANPHYAKLFKITEPDVGHITISRKSNSNVKPLRFRIRMHLFRKIYIFYVQFTD